MIRELTLVALGVDLFDELAIEVFELSMMVDMVPRVLTPSMGLKVIQLVVGGRGGCVGIDVMWTGKGEEDEAPSQELRQWVVQDAGQSICETVDSEWVIERRFMWRSRSDSKDSRNNSNRGNRP